MNRTLEILLYVAGSLFLAAAVLILLIGRPFCEWLAGILGC
ncbi:hypothetical protein [Paraburkholderia silvatlantica]|nr:hypothetical protein [Paraburkholderia silvatlantica]